MVFVRSVLNRAALVAVSVAVTLPALAQTQTGSALDPGAELRREQERSQAQQKLLQKPRKEQAAPDHTPTVAPPALIPDDETPCFTIKWIELNVQSNGASSVDRLRDFERFSWLSESVAGVDHSDSPLNRCLGANGVATVLKRAQEALVAKGFVTTRVLAQAQDLTTGVLVLTIIPGRVNAIRLVDAANPALVNTVPIKARDILNLRDIEQGLENFKRVPTVEADIKIEPAKDAGPDQSDLLVTYAQSAPARFTATLDDSGSKGTGKFQGSSTLSLDNPLGLSDLFYLTLNHDLNSELGHELGNTLHGDRGTRGYTLHYSLPAGYWTLGANHSSSRYFQKVAGRNQDYLYSGTSETNDITISRLVYRDAIRKTTTSLKAFQRESNNYIDDTEVQNQRRSVGGFELGLNHKDVLGDAKLEGSIAYKRGTKDFDSIPAPEESFNEGTARFGLVTLDASVAVPFKVKEQSFKYSGAVRIQDNITPLTPQDRFSIGSRYSVRGFDGESSLVGERGWTLRNEVSTALGSSGQELYLGIDTGEVSGPSTRTLLGTTLSGAVIGLRGAVKAFQYDVFVGTPLYKPAGFKTADATAGFNVTWSL
jgi:hemolysin activation/secretion protein